MTEQKRKCVEGPYSITKTYAHAFEHKPRKFIPEAGAIAEAGAGRAGAEWHHISAKAKGPNVSAEAKAEVKTMKAGTKTRVEFGSVSASSGPFEARLGVGAEASVGFNTGQGILDIIDYFDRPEKTKTEGMYSGTHTYAYCGINKPGMRIPKAGAEAEAGVGRARAELNILSAEARGPNVYAGAQANILGASALARAEVGSVSASAGPIGIKLGLGVDTGVSISPEKTEIKFLGTGIIVGQEGIGFAILGNEFKCNVM